MAASSDDQSVEIALRDPGDVASRATVLGALAYRGFLEFSDDQVDPSEAADERFDLLSWLHDESVIDHVDPVELALFQAAVGMLREDEALSATWAAEALAPLCWALGLMPKPPPAEQTVDAAIVLGLVPTPGSSTSAFIRQATLRDEIEIATARETAELWYWRAAVQELLGTASSSERNELVVAILETAQEAASEGILPPLARGDFSVNGLPYAVASDHDVLATIAEWRLRALNWLCGFGESWATVPLDL